MNFFQMSIVVLALLSLCSGCRREHSESVIAGTLATPLSAEAHALMEDVTRLKEDMFAKGIAMGDKSYALAQRMTTLSKDEQARVVHAFMEEVDRLGTLEVKGFRKLVVWLYNYQQILMSVDLCTGNLDDREWPFRQYALCCARYARALADCRDALAQTTDKEERRQLQYCLVDLKTDYGTHMTRIRKTYLPFVAEKTLPPERYLYWKNYFEEKFARENAK